MYFEFFLLLEEHEKYSEHRVYFSLRREMYMETSEHPLVNLQHYRRVGWPIKQTAKNRISSNNHNS